MCQSGPGSVTYWPSTEGLNSVQLRRHRKLVDVKQLYNPVPQTVSVSWGQLVGVRVVVRGSENQLPAEGLGPQDSQQNEKEVLL